MTGVHPLNQSGVFEQGAIDAMAFALDDICTAMHVRPTAKYAREAIAVRIIELASHGETDPTQLRTFMLRGWPVEH
jgi:hypothetical protein